MMGRRKKVNEARDLPLRNIINSVKGFKELLNKLRSQSNCVDFTFDEKTERIDGLLNKISKKCKRCEEKEKIQRIDCCYGIFIIWCIEGSEPEVLRIGKVGTIDNSGKYDKYGVYKIFEEKGSELLSELKKLSESESKESNRECTSFKIEILCLDCYNDNRKIRAKPRLFIPSFIEALLLQYYLWENKKLPPENNEL